MRCEKCGKRITEEKFVRIRASLFISERRWKLSELGMKRN